MWCVRWEKAWKLEAGNTVWLMQERFFNGEKPANDFYWKLTEAMADLMVSFPISKFKIEGEDGHKEEKLD